jgi:ribosomal-protein-alanine N-acetyltransferase
MTKLRKFEPSDLPEIVKLAKLSFPKNRILAKSFERYYQSYPDGFIVSEELGELTGYIIGQVQNEIGQITSLAVRPAFREKGVGTELVEFLTQHFKKNSSRELFLHVRAENNIAISFFQNLDFRILNTIKKYYRKRDSAFLMGKAI